MSNVNAPAGLVPRYHLGGRSYVGTGTPCIIPSSDSGSYFVGDPVVLVVGSNTAATGAMNIGAAQGAAGQAIGTLPYVGISTAGDTHPIYGVIVRVAANAAANYGTPIYRHASTTTVVYVETDPSVIYELQVNGTLASTSVNKTANLDSSVSGSTNTGLSGWQMNSSTGTTYTFQLLVVGVTSDPNNNDLSSSYPKALVRINNSQVYTVGITGAS